MVFICVDLCPRCEPEWKLGHNVEPENMLFPKRNPLMDKQDLCTEPSPTDEGLELNTKTLETDQSVVFDPTIPCRIETMGSRFFTLDSESPTNMIPSRRLKLTEPHPRM
jgi:hypothetical protein